MNWDSILQNELIVNTGIAFGIFILFMLFRRLFTKYLFKFILRVFKKSPTTFFTNVWLSFEKPINWIFVMTGFYISAIFFPFIDVHAKGFQDFYRSTIIILIAWGFLNLSSTSSIIFQQLNKKLNLHVDQILIPFLSKLLRVTIILFTIAIIAAEFDYNIGTLVAGLGIGGLAISLAAQDALKNFIGGTVLLFERPFTIGDWITTPTVDGVVEEISFRSTKVRTFDQALVTVPNATLSAENIKNWSKMGKRQYAFHLQLDHSIHYDKLEIVVKRLREMIKNHEDVHPETIYVNFDRFSPQSFDIYVYLFTKTTDYGEFLSVKEDINFRIMEILSEEGVSLAIPIQTIRISEEDLLFKRYYITDDE